MSQYIQVPPDSTGKKTQQTLTIHVDYVNGTNDFEIGDLVTGGSSGAAGEIVQVDPTNTTATGTIHVRAEEHSPPDFEANEDLIVDSTKYAEVQDSDPVHAQDTLLVGGNNPFNRAAVDKKGALYTRSAEGENNFDAFGKLQSSESTTIGEYTLTYDDNPEDIYYNSSGTGSVTHHSEYAGITLSTGTASGDSISGQTNLYHKYQPGIGQTWMGTLSFGDQGKAGVTRRWGYYDDKDGCFFELADSTLNIVVRSSVTGSIQETRIPQNQWNGDRVDGSQGRFNLSGLDLDVTELTVWWVDFQWLGAGRVRFGLYSGGRRIVLQSNEINTTGGLPYMRTGTLPVRFEQFNTSTTASSSTMRTVCQAVLCEGKFLPKKRFFSSPFELPVSPVTTTTYQPLFSARPKQTFKGLDNRSVILPEDISIYAYNSPVEVAIVKNGTLTGDAYSLDPGNESALEIDGSATALSGGRTVWTKSIAPNQVFESDLSKFFNFEQGDTVHRSANIMETDQFTLVARKMKTGDTDPEVSVAFNWSEVQ